MTEQAQNLVEAAESVGVSTLIADPRQAVFSYDVEAIPEGLDFSKILEAFQEHGVVLYDGSKGNKPEITNLKINLVRRDL